MEDSKSSQLQENKAFYVVSAETSALALLYTTAALLWTYSN
jgi:hypothetical protein